MRVAPFILNEFMAVLQKAHRPRSVGPKWLMPHKATIGKADPQSGLMSLTLRAAVCGRSAEANRGAYVWKAELAEHIRQQDYKLRSERPEQSINFGFQRLVNDGLVTVAVPASGTRPAKFRIGDADSSATKPEIKALPPTREGQPERVRMEA